MQPYLAINVRRLRAYVEEIEADPYRRKREIDLKELAALMREIGIEGPIPVRGSVYGFRHELLAQSLTGGQFTIHIIHGKKRLRAYYYDFKKYMLPNIQLLLTLIESKNLTREE